MIYTNPIFSGSINVSGSLNLNGASIGANSISSSFALTASYAHFAVSASHEITLETSSSYANLSTVSETIQETRVGTALSFWQGTQAQYDGLGSYDPDTIYLVE